MLNEAIDVAADGKLAAAQALAASVFDTILRHTFKPQRMRGYYEKVKAEIGSRHETALISELRWGIVHLPVVVALDLFDQPKGDPISSTFNRHAQALTL